MNNIIDLNKYRFEKMKKEVSPELFSILDTPMGKQLYAVVYLKARHIEYNTEGAAMAEQWLDTLSKTLNMTLELTILFAFEVFTEAIFNKCVNEVTTKEIEEWLES